MDCGTPKGEFIRLDAHHHHCQTRSESNRFSTLRWHHLLWAGDDLSEHDYQRLLAALGVKHRWPNRPHGGRRFAPVAETVLQRGDRSQVAGNPIPDIE